ncbi:MAG: ABC transporter substrate-binding protein [Acidipropionibacterium sp.]|jgi:NitT/TauT family transport system substrate-binding protein|nr:ABC transporter substrate-binding protein [Acidipropionibacterium sp.]
MFTALRRLRPRTLIASSLAGALLLAGLVGCGARSSSAASSSASGSAGLATLRLGVMTDNVTSYVATIGIEKKIFQKNHLDVKVSNFGAGIDTVNAVTTNQADIGFAADFAILNRIGAAPSGNLRIFTELTRSDVNNPQSGVLYGKGISSPADLAGKGIVTVKGTVVEYWVAKILEKYKIDPSSVKQYPVESSQEGLALLQSGQAAAQWTNGKGAKLASKIPGVKPIATLKTIDAPTINVGVATDTYLKAHPTEVENYLKSVNEVYQFIEKNPDEAAAILQKANNIPKEQALLNIKASINKLQFTPSTYSTLDGIKQWGVKNGVIKNDFDVKGYLNLDALKATFPDAVTYK